MDKSARFCFYGSLNDFIQASRRDKTWITYPFKDTPAVKDAIEAIGIPHPEVKAILLNGTTVGFLQPLHNLDQVEVFPYDHNLELPQNYSISSLYAGTERFVLDVHLGKLARALRMLGFDTLYENDYSDKTIAEIAERERRIVLSRDVGLLKQKSIQWGYWLRSQQSEEQLAEVVRYFKLHAKFHPFTRCLACNGIIEEVSKESVLDLLPPRTRQYFNEFFRCRSCRRVYWKGSHYDHMQEFIRTVNSSSGNHHRD